MGYRTIDLNDPLNFAPFDGDGRKKVAPSEMWKEMRPNASAVAMTRGMARMTIEKFHESGFMKFEHGGGALWVIETWCYRHDVEIKVVKHPFGGWYAMQLEQNDPEPAEEPYDPYDPFAELGDDYVPHQDGRVLVNGFQ